MSRPNARATAEHAARTGYGRLVALLTQSTGDLQLAEDCVAGAFERALTAWPSTGVPDNPEAWLLTVARNKLRDWWKSAAARTGVPLHDVGAELDAILPTDDQEGGEMLDKRLELLVLCADPAIDPATRAPLMLQAVLGFEAAQIAAAFAVPPATMSQRLVRAKRRLKASKVPFALPDAGLSDDRLPAVLEAVYGCYAIDWTAARVDESLCASMSEEARYLAVAVANLTDHPEAWGLAALVTLSLARRIGAPGAAFVPLLDQDPATWDQTLIAEGEAYLRRASHGPAGRFQLEAAVHAVHGARARTGAVDDAALKTLYLALDRVAPTLGGRVALAAALGRADGPAVGLAALDEIGDLRSVAAFQPYWTARAHLLAQAAQPADAARCWTRAIALTDDSQIRAHLEERLRSAIEPKGDA